MERTRTSTVLLPSAPQADASANSATTAQTRRILSYLIGRCHGFDRLRAVSCPRYAGGVFPRYAASPPVALGGVQLKAGQGK